MLYCLSKHFKRILLFITKMKFGVLSALLVLLLVGFSEEKRSSRLMSLLGLPTEPSNQYVDNADKHSSSYNSVLTNQVYQEDNDNKQNSFNLYQKLMGVKTVKAIENQNNINKQEYGFNIMQQLVDAKNTVGDGIIVEATDIIQAALGSEGIDMIKTGVNIVLETILHGIMEGFLPSVERVRRDADGEKRTYMDTFVSLMGRLRCSHFVACRMGKWFQGRLPSAELAVMMVESLIPEGFLEWFGVVKISVIDRSDNCDANYQCSLHDMIEDEVQ